MRDIVERLAGMTQAGWRYFDRIQDDKWHCAIVDARDEIERLRKALDTVCTAVEREPVCGGDLDYPHGHNDWLGWRKKIMRPAVASARAALDAVKETGQ